jgi:hypothetical protein
MTSTSNAFARLIASLVATTPYSVSTGSPTSLGL